MMLPMRPNSDDSRVLRRYMPELDVLRGLAVLMVVLFHGLYWSGAADRTTGLARRFVLITAGGWLGVNLFFVLSGFLITGILLDTKQRDDYYRRFYMRRALRILPIYFVTLAVLASDHGLSWKAFAVCIIFLANYSTQLHAGLTYMVLWSLSVEEQFYLVWPTVVRRTSVNILTWTAVVLFVGEPVLRWMAATHRVPLTDVRGNTLLILDNLAAGALAAIFVRSSIGTKYFAARIGALALAIGVGLEVVGIRFGILHRDTAFGSAFKVRPGTSSSRASCCFRSAGARALQTAPGPHRFASWAISATACTFCT